jgi:hypothetical protein
VDDEGHEIIVETGMEIQVSTPSDIRIKYTEVDDPDSHNNDTTFPGHKRKNESCEIVLSSDPEGIVIARVTDVQPGAALTLDKAVRSYTSPVVPGNLDVEDSLSVQGGLSVKDGIAVQGSLTVRESLEVQGDLTVKGSLTVRGKTTVVETQEMRGNVVLGDGDEDMVTFNGSLTTGHSSGKLKVDAGVDISGPLKVSGILELPENGLAVGGNQLVVAGGNVGIGTASPEVKLHILGDLLGAAKDVDNNPLRIVTGKTIPYATNWKQYRSFCVYVEIDTSFGNFTSVPLYFTSIGGDVKHWNSIGATSIYSPSIKSFSVYVSREGDFTTQNAREWGWYINWVAIGR